MPEDKSAVREFLEGLGTPKEDPFKSDDPFDSKGAEKDVVVEEDKKEEKPLPFNRDPKVQKYVQKEIAKALEGIKASPSETRQVKEAALEDTDDLIAAFAEVIGNDTPEKVRVLKALEKNLSSVEERAASKAVERFNEQSRAEVERQTREEEAARQELEEGFEEIEETFNVDLSSNTAQARKLNEDFRTYVRKVAPKDRETGEVRGFPDLVATFEEFQERQKRGVNPASRAKELASRGLSRSNDASVTPPIVDKSWKGVDKFINNLSS